MDFDEELDTHICLKCQKTIVGLDNYVIHKRTECPNIFVKTGIQAANDQLSKALKDPIRPSVEIEVATTLTTSEPSQLKSDDFFLSLELKSSKTVGQKCCQDQNDASRVVEIESLPVEELAGNVSSAELNSLEKDSSTVGLGEDCGKGFRDDDEYVYLEEDDEDGKVDDDDEDYDEFDDCPPRGHTGGKWKPGMRPEDTRLWLSSFPQMKNCGLTKSVEMGKPGSFKAQIKSIAWKCGPCDITFSTERGLVSHLASSQHWLSSRNHPLHRSLILRYSDALAPLAPYKCSICAFYFNDVTQLINHWVKEESGHREKVGPHHQLLCTSCKYRCWTNEQMLEHLNNTVHQEGVSCWNPVVVSATTEFCCSKCEWTCRRRQALFSHMRWKHSTNVYCPTCRISFQNEDALNLHNALNEHVIKGHDCPFCPFVGETKSSIEAHTKQEHQQNVRQDAVGINEPIDYLEENCQFGDSGTDENAAIKASKKSKADSKRFPPKGSPQPTEKQKSVANRKQVISVVQILKTEPSSDSINGVQSSLLASESMPTNMHKGKTNDHSYFEKDSPSSSNEEVVNGKDSDYGEDFLKPSNVPRLQQVRKVCGYCDVKCSDQKLLKSHLEKIHPEKLLRCEPCCASFVYKSEFEMHSKSRLHLCNTKDLRDIEKGLLSPSEALSCPHCEFRSASKSAILFHEMMHVPKSQITIENAKKARSKFLLYKCPVCTKSFSGMRLRDHLNVHTGERPFICSICQASFPLRASLSSHQRSKHGEKKHVCPHCPYRSYRKAKLSEHLETHGDRVREYTCEVCGAGFYKSSALQTHVKIHLEDKGKRFFCTFEGCSKAFRTPSELVYHGRVHSGDSPFLCETCGYSTKSRHQLTKHERGHNGVRPFKCNYCSYASSRSAQLRRHMRIHSQVKPYSCPYCTYTSNTQENLRKHVLKSKKHQGLSVYPCQHCSFGCNSANEMKDHVLEQHKAIAKQFDEDSPAFASMVTGIYNQKSDVRVPDKTPAPYVPLTEKRDMYKNLHSKLRAKAAAYDIDFDTDNNSKHTDGDGDASDKDDDDSVLVRVIAERVGIAAVEQSEICTAVENLMESTKRKRTSESEGSFTKRAKENDVDDSPTDYKDNDTLNENSQLYHFFQDTEVSYKQEEIEVPMDEPNQIAIYTIEFPNSEQAEQILGNCENETEVGTSNVSDDEHQTYQNAIILPFDSVAPSNSDADEETLAIIQNPENYQTVTATDNDGETVILYMPISS